MVEVHWLALVFVFIFGFFLGGFAYNLIVMAADADKRIEDKKNKPTG